MIESLMSELGGPMSLPWAVIAVRLVGAVVLCGLIGYERESQHRPAGLRTHMLVGLAAAVYCILTLEIIAGVAVYPDTVRIDPLRIIEAVTSGVAFLAAGMVVFSQGRVRGLTTGAGMWLAASVGLSCGLGLWLIAGLSTALALAIMRIASLSERISGKTGKA